MLDFLTQEPKHPTAVEANHGIAAIRYLQASTITMWEASLDKYAEDCVAFQILNDQTLPLPRIDAEIDRIQNDPSLNDNSRAKTHAAFFEIMKMVVRSVSRFKCALAILLIKFKFG